MGFNPVLALITRGQINPNTFVHGLQASSDVARFNLLSAFAMHSAGSPGRGILGYLYDRPSTITIGEDCFLAHAGGQKIMTSFWLESEYTSVCSRFVRAPPDSLDTPYLGEIV